MRRSLRLAGWLGLPLIAFIYVNNSDLFVSRDPGEPVLLAHRGIAQRFDATGVTGDTCTAERMLPSDHDFIENTIPSMEASFTAGADIVELDVHPTTDGHFAVFHDWTLDCRTDGTGVTREHSIVQLRYLDVGYGYTPDGGRTYPLRGKGVGLMPTLTEVLARFPGRRFVINVKSRDLAEAEKLAAFLNKLNPDQRALLIIAGGGNDVIGRVKQLQPDIRVVSRQTIKACLMHYAGYGWTGVMPEPCKGTIMMLPINVAPWLWGWPNRLLNRFESVDTPVFVLGPYGGGGFSSGIDTAEELSRLPAGYSGGIWTNELAFIAKALKSR